jgi:hypothetical protein
MYWRALLGKQPSKAMLKLVCWFYFQVLALLHFLPWVQVTFWEGAQTRMISMRCDWVDMGQPLMDLHWFVFPLVFGKCGQKLQKPPGKLKKQVGGVHEWLGHVV